MTKLWLAALCAGFALGASARADEYRESVAVRAGGTLEVDLPMGALEIETHDENSVDVEASSGAGGWSGGLEFTLSGDGTNAKLVARSGGWFSGWKTARARVRVPEQYSLELETGGGSIEIEAVEGSVRAQTSGGGIGLEGAVGPVELTTSGGPIRVEDVEGDTVLRTSGGGITASDIEGNVEARSSGGPIRVHDVEGRVSARTSGGGISVRFESAPAGELRTSGGGIEVEFPEGLGAELDARTSGGDIETDVPVTLLGKQSESTLNGKLNGGGPRVVLRSSGGDIRLRKM